MKKNYLKISLIALVLAGLVAPIAIGMAVDRPVTKIERCTLRHDFSDRFDGDYSTGAVISAEQTAVGDIPNDFPAGGIIDLTSQTGIGKTWQSGLIEAVTSQLKNLGDANCSGLYNTLYGANGTHKITKTVYDTYAACAASPSGKAFSYTTGLLSRLPWIGGAVSSLNMDNLLKLLRQLGASAGVDQYRQDAAIVCLLDLIETVGDWMFAVVLIFAGIFILWGGATMVFAAGSPEKIKKARDILIWSGVGVAIAFLSKGLIKLVEQIIA